MPWVGRRSASTAECRENLMKSMERAKEELQHCDWDKDVNNFATKYAKNMNESMTDLMGADYRKKGVSKRLTDQFDDLVADVESRIIVLENMKAEQCEPRPAVERYLRRIESSTSDIRRPGSKGGSDETPSASVTKKCTLPIEEIDTDLKVLEERIEHIEHDFSEDVEAEQIGIPFQVDDLIDYATKMRKVMYKRIFLIRGYQSMIRNDRRFKEKAKNLTRQVVKWGDGEKKAVLTALTALEGSLEAQRRSLVVINQSFNKIYPLENDLNIVQALLGHFLDKYQSADNRSKRDENFIASLITSPGRSRSREDVRPSAEVISSDLASIRSSLSSKSNADSNSDDSTTRKIKVEDTVDAAKSASFSSGKIKTDATSSKPEDKK